MKLVNAFSLSVCFAITLYANNSFAGSCSKSDVDHYLKSGFSHDQIVKLCANAVAQPAPAPTKTYQAVTGAAPVTAAPVSAAAAKDANQIYFETVIKGDPVTLSSDSLIFERRECVAYGEIDMTQTRDKACVNTRTTIGLKNLQIVRAQKGIIMIKKQELVVQGNITREFLGFGNNNKYKIAAIRKQLPTQPATLDIPIKKGIDPTQVVTKLKLYR